MKKRYLSLILTLVLAFCVLGSPKNVAIADHVHPTQWTVTSKPTFINSGEIVESCLDTSCGYSQVVGLSSLNTPIVWFVNFGVDGNGYFNGTATYTVNDAGSSAFEQTVVYSASELNALGYNVTFQTEPTKTEEGFVSFKNSGNSEINGLVKLPNLNSDKWQKTVSLKPDCENEGQTTYTYADYPTLKLTLTDIDALGHKKAWVVTTAPTSSLSGEAKYKCVNTGCLVVDSTITLPAYSSTFETDDNYFVVVNRAPGQLIGNARFYLKKGLGSTEYYEDIYFDVEMPALTIEKFYIENGALYVKFTNGTIDSLGVVQGENGQDGKDGTNGTNGQDGKDGINGTNGKDGSNGINGTNGLDGADGKDGAPGANGINGKDGKDGKSYLALAITSISFAVISLGLVLILAYLILKKKI